MFHPGALYGLFKRIVKKKLIYLRRHLALLWLPCCSLLMKIIAQGSASHCVTRDTRTPVLITYLFSQSLKGKFNLTMEGILVISASLLACLMVYDFSVEAEKDLSHTCIKTSGGKRDFHIEWFNPFKLELFFFFPKLLTNGLKFL